MPIFSVIFSIYLLGGVFLLLNFGASEARLSSFESLPRVILYVFCFETSIYFHTQEPEAITQGSTQTMGSW